MDITSLEQCNQSLCRQNRQTANMMCITYAVSFATLLAVTYGAVPPAGKCDTYEITPVSLDAKTLLGEWDFTHVTDDGKTTGSIDHISAVVTPNQDHTMKLVSTGVLKDKTSSSQEYKLSVVDNVITEDAIDNGKPTHFHIYPLASSPEGAYLLYRCAHVSRSPVDDRYIAVPKGKTLSEKSLKQLLDADKKQNFKGELVKLPNQHS